jgi:hypothetical protein
MATKTKIALANVRSNGVRTLLVYCTNAPLCWHSTTINADRWSDDVRLSDLEPLFVCTQCGAKGAELRPNYGALSRTSYSYGPH